MKIIPGTGTDSVSFGMTGDEVATLLGAPHTVTPYCDFPGYPPGRENWSYNHLDILMTSTHGVIAVTADCTMPGLSLWGQPLNGCDVETLDKLLQQADEPALSGEQDQWGDIDICLTGAGLGFALSDDELVAVEVRRPDWKEFG